jgi:hypothetical protein
MSFAWMNLCINKEWKQREEKKEPEGECPLHEWIVHQQRMNKMGFDFVQI